MLSFKSDFAACNDNVGADSHAGIVRPQWSSEMRPQSLESASSTAEIVRKVVGEFAAPTSDRDQPSSACSRSERRAHRRTATGRRAGSHAEPAAASAWPVPRARRSPTRSVVAANHRAQPFAVQRIIRVTDQNRPRNVLSVYRFCHGCISQRTPKISIGFSTALPPGKSTDFVTFNFGEFFTSQRLPLLPAFVEEFRKVTAVVAFPGQGQLKIGPFSHRESQLHTRATLRRQTS